MIKKTSSPLHDKNKKIIMKKRYRFSLTILIYLVFSSCNNNSIVSQSDFINENRFKSFEDWKYQTFSRHETWGYYIMIFQIKDSVNRELIVWNKDSLTNIRLTLPDSMSDIYTLNELKLDVFWERHYYYLNVKKLKEQVDFLYKYSLEKVLFDENPDRLFFESDSISAFYLFEPSDSGYSIFTQRVANTNWYIKGKEY